MLWTLLKRSVRLYNWTHERLFLNWECCNHYTLFCFSALSHLWFYGPSNFYLLLIYLYIYTHKELCRNPWPDPLGGKWCERITVSSRIWSGCAPSLTNPDFWLSTWSLVHSTAYSDQLGVSLSNIFIDWECFVLIAAKCLEDLMTITVISLPSDALIHFLCRLFISSV